MSKHKASADYHRAEATKAFDKQGEAGSDYVRLRSEQMHHTQAAQRAEEAYADENGMEVRYTPIGQPVYYPK